MSILSAIKKVHCVRQFRAEKLPSDLMNKIIDAGLWGPSVHGFQPWYFFVIREKDMIEKIAEICLRHSKRIGIGAGPILSFTAANLKKTPNLILIYNTHDFSRKAVRLKKTYRTIAAISEVQAIGSCIQNMQLQASELGIGSVWLTSPLFCSKEINQLIGVNVGELTAMLGLGYFDSSGKRSKRKQREKAVSYYK